MAGGHGSASGPTGMGLYVGAPSSETDGETFDAETDFDDYEEWNYHEVLSALTKNVKTYILQPLVVGASAAFGMSVGYALYDATAALFGARRQIKTKSS